MEWKPIETAPPGRRLMVANDKWFGPAAPVSDGEWFMRDSFFFAFESEADYLSRPNCIKPTHWMPLPPPPVKEGAEAREVSHD